MSQKLNFYNTKYTGMRHLGATLIFKNTVYVITKNILFNQPFGHDLHVASNWLSSFITEGESVRKPSDHSLQRSTTVLMFLSSWYWWRCYIRAGRGVNDGGYCCGATEVPLANNEHACFNICMSCLSPRVSSLIPTVASVGPWLLLLIRLDSICWFALIFALNVYKWSLTKGIALRTWVSAGACAACTVDRRLASNVKILDCWREHCWRMGFHGVPHETLQHLVKWFFA